MAVENEIHLNDIGTEFIVVIVDFDLGGVPIDISTATSKEIVFLNPSGVRTSHPANFVTDGTDGAISFFTVLGDLDPIGNYKIQGIVTTPSGKWHSTVDKFKVIDNL